MRRICIFDTTLRDGEQAPGCTMNPGEKLALARQLERLGVDVIEAGFPVASPDDFTAVETIAMTLTRTTVAALCRAVREDVEAAAKAVAHARYPRLHVFIATSDLHLREKLNITREKALEMIAENVALACSLCEDVEFSAEDATRSDRDFLLAALNTAIDAGASTVNVPDTVGYTTPEEMGELITWLRRNLHKDKNGGDVVLSVHCHNDGGQLPGSHPGRGRPGGGHHQRHRGAGRECLLGRGHHGPGHQETALSGGDRHRPQADLPHLPLGLHRHRPEDPPQ